MAAPKVWPGESSEAHPEVFTKIPVQTNPGVSLPGQFTNEHLNQFFDKVGALSAGRSSHAGRSSKVQSCW